MCGIAGIAGKFEREQALGEVDAMIGSLARRGPDGEGVEVWDQAILGHRRLAIFDLSELGRQPMMSPDRSVGIVFNGAIYNFRELRVELESKGYKFTSQTDTEVLIHGYDAWGIDQLVCRIQGMFAVALWDDRKRSLYLVRDRLGVKPLTYAVRNGALAFASTVRALRTAGFVQEIDQEAITEFLEFGYVTDDRAIYRGAVKVPAATIVEWSGDSVSARAYWKLPSPAEHSSAPSFAEAVEETERLLLRAVEKRLFADVPVGALLSGGVDSSLVCWAIAKLGGNITSFTIGTPGDPWDETEDARATAAQLGISHRVLDLSADDAPGMDEMVSAYAEPFACASAMGMLRVSRAVAPEATVLLTGDGGDDVFLGYPEHRNLWLAQRFARRLPASASNLWLRVRDSVPRQGLSKRAASFLDYACGGLGAVAWAHDGLPMYEKNGFLGERLVGKQVAQRAIPWTSQSARNLLEEFLEYDRATRFVGEYMTKVDGGTMYHALEARSPFLDQDLWEFAASLPFDLRLRNGRLKAVLRELAADKLGERVARGRKRGFSIPVQRWLAGRWRGDLADLLRESQLEREGWILSAPVLSRLEKAAQEGWAPNQLWYIFVLESWLRHEQNQAASHPPVAPALLSDRGGKNGSSGLNSSASHTESALLPSVRP
jgi:asparagine synthase (glutamine-hydrolysing)